MLTKERLEELIEQDKVFYWVFNKEIRMLCNLSTPTYWKNNWKLYGKDCFETREEAEWYIEFGCIERTERLELPTWEEIENIIDKKKRFGLNHSDRVLARIITNDSIYYFKLCKDLDLFTFELKQTYIGEDLCEQLTSRFPVGLGKATKENYTLACRKAKELFLGEKK